MATDGSADNSILAARLTAAQAAMAVAQRRVLDVIVECEEAQTWRYDGSRDLAQWLSAHLGISNWAARRWVVAARVLPHLPRIAEAFEAGTLSLEKVVELCRFATPDDEHRLIPWARRVSAAAIRRRADLANRPELEDVVTDDRNRYVRYAWLEDDTRMWLEGLLPADQGAVVAKALDRLAERMPDIIEDDDDPHRPSWTDTIDARRADALAAMASQVIARDADPDRATVVVHADIEALTGHERGCEIEDGPVIHPETARRLACDCRLAGVLYDRERELGVGRASRIVPRWLARQLRYRDRCCTFPGCGRRRWLHAHHIVHWVEGGLTELDNLTLTCPFHHKLLHEFGWRVRLKGSITEWFRPDGTRYEPTRDPPNSVGEQLVPMPA